MANAPAHGLDTRECTDSYRIVSTVSRLREAVDDYNRMHEMLKAASPVVAKHIREDMELQRRVISALVDSMEEEVSNGEL